MVRFGSVGNIILIDALGPIGPNFIQYPLKIQKLLVSPIKCLGRALMSITGHLFGARKFDSIRSMYYYALKLSLATTAIIMTIF